MPPITNHASRLLNLKFEKMITKDDPENDDSKITH